MGSPGPLAPPERPLVAEWAPKQSASSVRGKGQANHRPKNLAALCRFRSFQRYAILNPESSRWPDFHFLSSNPLLGAGGKCVPALPCLSRKANTFIVCASSRSPTRPVPGRHVVCRPRARSAPSRDALEYTLMRAHTRGHHPEPQTHVWHTGALTHTRGRPRVTPCSRTHVHILGGRCQRLQRNVKQHLAQALLRTC